MLMPTVNYLHVINCENDSANRNESYKKPQRNYKRKPRNTYLYTNQLK